MYSAPFKHDYPNTQGAYGSLNINLIALTKWKVSYIWLDDTYA